VSFAAITVRVASRRMFIVIRYRLSPELLDTPSHVLRHIRSDVFICSLMMFTQKNKKMASKIQIEGTIPSSQFVTQ